MPSPTPSLSEIPLFAGLPVYAVTEQDCAQWIAWKLWNRKTAAIPATSPKTPVENRRKTRGWLRPSSMTTAADATTARSVTPPLTQKLLCPKTNHNARHAA